MLDRDPPTKGTASIKYFKSALVALDSTSISSAAKFDARASSNSSGINGVEGDEDVSSIVVIKIDLSVSNQMVVFSQEVPSEKYGHVGSNPLFEDPYGEQGFLSGDLANTEDLLDQPYSSDPVDEEDGEIPNMNDEGSFIKVRRKKWRPRGKNKIAPLPKRMDNRNSLPKCFTNFKAATNNST
ncbi:hypothetical protein SUGI_0142930 [Cryptomeria japonica]|nr:hypothetical protein SUGI_0142930 [Cryptomeria japonica]